MMDTRAKAGDAPAAARGAPITQRVVLVAILLVTLLVGYLDRVNVSVLVADDAFLKTMGIEGRPVSIGLLMTAFLVAYGVSNVFLGPIGDRIGPRKAMSLSILLWALALLWFFTTDHPRQNRWIRAAERDAIAAALHT